jgi:hypothetical protein
MALTPKEFAFASTVEECAAIGLDPIEGGYGLLLCEDENQQRVTVITDDPDYARMLVDADPSVRRGLEVPPGKFFRQRAGWPDDWSGATS